jgi:hypothetical protein
MIAHKCTDIQHTTILQPIHPLASRSALTCPLLYDLTPLFTYLENQLLLLVVQIPIHSCPWFAINCSPLAASPTSRYPTDQVTYLHRRHQQCQPSRLTQKVGQKCSISMLIFILSLPVHVLKRLVFANEPAKLL